MDDTWMTLAAAFGGVLLGGLVSLLTSVVLLNRQVKLQEDYEVRIRVLNSYQDFSNSARQLLAFQDEGPDTLWAQALATAHKALNDAQLLDVDGQERCARMREIVSHLARKPTLAERKVEIEHELDAIFDQYYENRRMRFWTRIR